MGTVASICLLQHITAWGGGGVGGPEPHISFLDPASHGDLVLLPRVHLKSKLAVDEAF